jgi:Leucine-rich repeat (LRR) protein
VLEPDLFSSLVRLQELRLDDNAIRNINPAVTVPGCMGVCFPQLRVLQLSNNRLLDPTDCVNRLAGMPMLAEVSVAGNPFTRKHQVCHIVAAATSTAH